MSLAVHTPDSVPGVLAALSEGGLVIAGGTHVMPRLNTEPSDVESLVSLRRAGLAGVAIVDGIARVGAATTLAQLGREPELGFLRGALEAIASPTIRNMATVGGNLFVGQPYGDLAVCLLALDAEVHVAGENERTIEVGEPIAPGELVTAVTFELPGAANWRFTKAMRRRLNSASIVTVAAVVKPGDVRIALGGVAPRPVRARAAEALLTGKPLDREHVEAAAKAAVQDAEPFTDAYASAWYRERVLPVHVRRALLGEEA
ncbi:FAD binding domain-containing protein [Candidatus Solirubrobacter pratensis]|uniref:FAD binding domain-containing protein n=1 Tax=Candidatus Solirubrobacter pratensis TaxID=1298857 RepID=UPI000427A054|nr:FAD binding domain-containing protein [Candidatus Solirubrobacter pratensis]